MSQRKLVSAIRKPHVIRACFAGFLSSFSSNFHVWKPGTVDPPTPPRAYSNVRIFNPLGMTQTGWHIREIESDRHAVLYTLVPDVEEGAEGFDPYLLRKALPKVQLNRVLTSHIVCTASTTTPMVSCGPA